MATEGKTVTFKAVLEKFPPQSGWHYITVTKEIASKFSFNGNDRRVVCTLNDAEPFQCALMPYSGAYFILVNKRKRTELEVEPGDTMSVKLEKDESEYGLPMPDELREVLNQDPEGDRLFHSLTRGKQRSLIYAVSTFKDIDRRIHTALIIVEHLRENRKIVDKKLHEELKRPVA